MLGWRSVGRRRQRYSFEHPNEEAVGCFGCPNERAVFSMIGVVHTMELASNEDELEFEQKGCRAHEVPVGKHGREEQGAAVFVPRCDLKWACGGKEATSVSIEDILLTYGITNGNTVEEIETVCGVCHHETNNAFTNVGRACCKQSIFGDVM